MMRLDTISLMVPAHTIRSVDDRSFLENSSLDLGTGEVTITKKAKSTHRPIGCSEIKYKDGGDYILTISAKTLKDSYLEGINLNTWEQAIRGVDEILDIDTNKLWDANPQVNKCDTTNNISIEQIGYSKADICRSLYATKMNERFSRIWYQTKRKLGVEFHGSQEEKNRIICYCKSLDLLKFKNKDFIKSLSNPLKVFNEADKTLRFETNHTHLRSMRDRFKVPQSNLQEVLNSIATVNHNFLQKVIKVDFIQAALYDEYENFNGQGMDFIFFKGLGNIITENECDEVKCRQFFKHILGDRSFKYYWSQVKTMTPIKYRISKMKAEQEKTNNIITASTQLDNVCISVLECLRLAI